jgi:radical SAM-linked protein
MQRIRISYKKFGDIIYTSNLDLQKIWERACRRADLNIAYTLGFHPQARIQQAAPLPLGFSSRTEIVDIWFETIDKIPVLMKRINLALPNGLEIFRIANIDLKDPALQNRIISSVYQVMLTPEIPRDAIEQLVTNLMKANTLKIIKRGKTVNLREMIESIVLVENVSNRQLLLEMQLTQRPGLTGRPDDILKAIGIDPFHTQIERINLIIS